MPYLDNAKNVRRGLIRKDVDARWEYAAGILSKASEICLLRCENGHPFSKTSRVKYLGLMRSCYELLTNSEGSEETPGEIGLYDEMPPSSCVNSQLSSRITLATSPTWEEDGDMVPVMGDDVAAVAELLTGEWLSREEITVRDL